MRNRNLNQVLVIDLESTCWETLEEQGSQPNEIIEVGYCLWTRPDTIYDKDKPEFYLCGTYIIKPENSKVSQYCTNLTTLTQEQVDKGISLIEALDDLSKKFGTKELTWVSWGDYDRKQFIRQLGYETYCKYFNTHINLKNLFSLMEEEPREYGMMKVLNKLKIVHLGTHHRGVDDALNIARIWDHMIYNYGL